MSKKHRAEGGVVPPVGDTNTITGTIQLNQDQNENVRCKTAGTCSGTRGYDDIRTGTNVVILDGSGNTLGTATLELAEGFEATGIWSNVCRFQFSVEVPGAAFYTIEIGRRGGPTYSFDEMQEIGWSMSLEIGR